MNAPTKSPDLSLAFVGLHAFRRDHGLDMTKEQADELAIAITQAERSVEMRVEQIVRDHAAALALSPRERRAADALVAAVAENFGDAPRCDDCGAALVEAPNCTDADGNAVEVLDCSAGCGWARVGGAL